VDAAAHLGVPPGRLPLQIRDGELWVARRDGWRPLQPGPVGAVFDLGDGRFAQVRYHSVRRQGGLRLPLRHLAVMLLLLGLVLTPTAMAQSCAAEREQAGEATSAPVVVFQPPATADTTPASPTPIPDLPVATPLPVQAEPEPRPTPAPKVTPTPEPAADPEPRAPSQRRPLTRTGRELATIGPSHLYAVLVDAAARVAELERTSTVVVHTPHGAVRFQDGAIVSPPLTSADWDEVLSALIERS